MMFETIIEALLVLFYLLVAFAYILIGVLALLKWSLLALMILAVGGVWFLVGWTMIRRLDDFA